MNCFIVEITQLYRRSNNSDMNTEATAANTSSYCSYAKACTGCQFSSDFKLPTLCFKSQVTGQPVYLSESLHPYQPKRSLRSSSLNLLTAVPYCNTKLGRRRCSVAAPLCSEQFIWDLRTDYDSLRTFKNNLKTFLYRRVITYPVSCGASDYSVLLEFGAILLLLSPCHLYRIS